MPYPSIPPRMRHRLPTFNSRHRGFTLVELLTVIAVVAILAGILIPVIGKIRQNSMVVQDVQNLRQIGVSMQLYAQDHNQVLPGPLYVNQITYYEKGRFAGHLSSLLAEYAGAPKPDEVTRRLDIMVDPAWYNQASDPDAIGATCYRIVQLRPDRGSTDWVYNQSIFGHAGYKGSDENKKNPLKLSTIPETVDLSGIPIVTNKNMSELDGLPSHINRRNVLFLDGHCETIPSTEPEFSLYY